MTPETMNANQTRYNHVVAFEVSKAELHVHVLPRGESCQIVNDRAHVRSLIKKQKRLNEKLGIGPLLVICEATGSYDAHVLDCAAELGVDCHRAHGSRVRAYAKYRGTHAKSDPIDVRLIADFGHNSEDLRLYKPPRPEQSDLRELVGRRTELRQMLEAEQARLENFRCKDVLESMRAHIRTLETLLAKIESKISNLIAKDEAFQRSAALMQSLKGVGPITAATVLAYLPEIGTVSGATIAALAGLAPFDDDSGKFKGQRHIFGGRAEVRNCLYMAAKVAMQHNPHMRDLTERVRAKGKSFKVAATAVMRKLLVILNAIIKSGKPCKMANAT